MPKPVYDPGGLTCIIDNLTIVNAADRQRVRAALLAEASRPPKDRSAVQTVVLRGHMDQPKRRMPAVGYAIASEWYVKQILLPPNLPP